MSLPNQDLIFLNSITHENIKEFFTPETLLRLVSIIESQLSENAILKIQIQKLQDENNRLKGEQGKPKFENKKQKPPKSADYSSEDERKNLQTKTNKRRGERNHEVKIDREGAVTIPPEDLPADAVFKGYDEIIVQDIKIVTDNIRYKVELWYSPSENKTYRAKRPEGYHGEFGPHLRALIPDI